MVNKLFPPARAKIAIHNGDIALFACIKWFEMSLIGAIRLAKDFGKLLGSLLETIVRRVPESKTLSYLV